MIEIYLLRHGQVPQIEPRRFTGQRDVPLTSEGQRQMAAWQEQLAGRPFAQVVSSDLRRCRESAALILANGRQPEPPIIIDPALKEISLGDWEGLTKAEVENRFPGAHDQRGRDIVNYRPPNGESFKDLLNRVKPAFKAHAQKALDSGGPLLVVTHLGVIRVLICELSQKPLGELLDIECDYACGYQLSFNGRLAAAKKIA